MAENTSEMAQVRLAANVDTQSVEGHDRDCARAIWSQANLGERLSTIQVEHLLSIGARSGRASALRDAANDIEMALDHNPDNVRQTAVIDYLRRRADRIATSPTSPANGDHA